MNSIIHNNEGNFNDSDNSTTIRRTFVEHGIRKINNNNNNTDINQNNSAIKLKTKQHEDEQRELQELNTKLLNYLEHVHNLETFNGQLLSELDDIKQKWSDNTEQINRTYSPQLNKFRDNIDNSLRDKIFQELQLIRYEYDIKQTQQRINAFDDDDITIRLNIAQQELRNSTNDLENLKNQFDQRSIDLTKQQTNLENLSKEFDGLQIELFNHRLERIMVENELQTLSECKAFDNANYQAQRKEILSLNIPVIDLSKFYRNELARSILDIRHDFEILSKIQCNELEEFYRIKTEELHEKLTQEKPNEETDMNTMLSLWIELNQEYKELKMNNNQLDIDLNDTLDDLTRIREEQKRENLKFDLEFNQLEQEFDNQQNIINKILDNNISLQFELLTYRNLLKSEEKRLNKNEEEQQQLPSNSKEYSLQKMAVKKTSKGSIIIDSIDFLNDCIIIIYDKSTGNNQSLANWTLHRQNDQQTEMIYQFPSSFILKPKQKIRILSKRSPQSIQSGNNILIADHIETWGHGQIMTTRLIDNNNDEKAIITQTRLPT